MGPAGSGHAQDQHRTPWQPERGVGRRHAGAPPRHGKQLMRRRYRSTISSRKRRSSYNFIIHHPREERRGRSLPAFTTRGLFAGRLHHWKAMTDM
jgi:hypothetical protein